jgi:hypothetical protein
MAFVSFSAGWQLIFFSYFSTAGAFITFIKITLRFSLPAGQGITWLHLILKSFAL